MCFVAASKKCLKKPGDDEIFQAAKLFFFSFFLLQWFPVSPTCLFIALVNTTSLCHWYLVLLYLSKCVLRFGCLVMCENKPEAI